MRSWITLPLAATLVAALVPQLAAQRGSDGAHRGNPAPVHAPSPAPVHRAPAPAPAPSPAPIQRHEPPPTRTYNPPPAPTPPTVRDTPRYSPPVHREPVQRDIPRYSPPVTRDREPIQPDFPRYSPPVTREPIQRDTPRYQPPDTGRSRRDSDSDRTTPPGSGGSPVRVVLPGDRGTRDEAPPAVGAPIPTRGRIRVGSDPVTGGGGSERSPSLRDLYRRVERDANTGRTPNPGLGSGGSDSDRVKVQPVLRDTLAGRYRDRLDRDLDRARPTNPGGHADVTPVRPGLPKAPDAIKVGASPRPSNPVAEHRYPTPGRDAKPVTPVRTNPGTRDIVAATPVVLQPNRRPPTTGNNNGGNRGQQPPHKVELPTQRTHYNAAAGRNPRGWHYGSCHWTGHRASLGFAFGHCNPSYRWGFYSYPFYYSCWWPRWSWCASWWYGSCWYDWTPSYVSCWWWPTHTTCYVPIAWNSYDSYSTWDSPSSYDVWSYSYPRTEVVVREVVREEAPATEVIHVPAAEPKREPEVTPAKLAEKHVSLGDFYFKESRFQEASESYLRALAYAPEDATIHFVLADALFAMGDYHYAAFIIGKALKLDPDLARSTADKRTFYKNAKTFEDQLATLRGYLKDKAYDAAAWLVLGYNLKFSGETEGAKRAFERVLEIDPGHEAAKVFLAAMAEKPASAPESRPASR